MGKKILLADDSITIQKVIELTFSDEDFDVVTVGNGRLALEKVQEIRPDIVLCDIIMPEKDGYEVCEFIKKSPALQHIPVLLLTGAFEPFDQERAARVGSDGYLAKPFEPETLIAKVKDLLSRAARPSAGAIPFAASGREPEPLRASPPSLPPPLTVVPPRPPEPLPFPRAASPEPFRAAPPPVEPPPLPVSFIPEEPFEDLDPASFGSDGEAGGAEVAEPLPFRSAADELLPMTPEESDSLGVHDTASTVMFSAGSVPWQTPAAPIPSIQAPPPPAPPPPPFEAVPVREAELVAEPTVFEEVIEEYVEFGGGYMPGGESAPEAVPHPPPPAYEPAVRPFEPPPARPAVFDVEQATETVEIRPSAPSAPPPPSRPPASAPRVAAPSAPSPVAAPPAFAPREPSAIDEPMPTVAIASPWPTAAREADPVPAIPAAPAPAPSSPPPVVPPAYVPPFVTHVAPPPVAEPAAPPSAESFADLVPDAPAAAEPAKPPSEAAEVAVPVEMVETIAQRVVAQISEKVVREIAWEVIPDLAEQLIKAEIERLKAELQRI